MGPFHSLLRRFHFKQGDVHGLDLSADLKCASDKVNHLLNLDDYMWARYRRSLDLRRLLFWTHLIMWWRIWLWWVLARSMKCFDRTFSPPSTRNSHLMISSVIGRLHRLGISRCNPFPQKDSIPRTSMAIMREIYDFIFFVKKYSTSLRGCCIGDGISRWSCSVGDGEGG